MKRPLSYPNYQAGHQTARVTKKTVFFKMHTYNIMTAYKSLKQNIVVEYIPWLVIAILLGKALATADGLLLLLLVSSIAFPLLLKNIKLVVYLMFVSVFFLDWLWGYLSFLPRQLTWLPEILSLVLLLRIVVDLSIGNIRIKNNFFTYFIYCWFFLSVIGIIINSVSPFVFLAGFRNYFKFIPLFLVFSWYPFSDKFVKQIVGILIFISVIQILFVIPEAIIYRGKSGDYIVGCLGAHASGDLGIFQLLIFSTLISLYKSNYYTLRRFITYGTLILLPAFITEAKVVFFILPIIMCVSFLDFRSKTVTRNFLILLLSLVILPGGVYIYNKIYSDKYGVNIQEFLFSSEKTADHIGVGELSFRKGGELRAISAIQFMFQNINKGSYTKFFGVGIGNASDSVFPESRGEYHEKYSYWVIGRVFFARFGWEYGYLGLMLLIVFFVILFNKKNNEKNDTFYTAMFSGKKNLAIISAWCFFYNSFLVISPLAFVFWFYLGIINNRLLTETDNTFNTRERIAL